MNRIRAQKLSLVLVLKLHHWHTVFDTYQGSHSFTDKNPGLSRTPMRIYHDLFGAHACLNIKKKPFPLLTPVLPTFPLP